MSLLIHGILLLLTSGAASDTEVVNGILNSYIVFSQSFSNPGLVLQWNFKGNLTASRYPPLAPECISSYAGRCQMYDDGTLRLDNLTYSDDGIYRFTAVQPPLTTLKDASYELRVYPVLNAPVISINSTSNDLISGSNVSLHCNASGQNVTTYTFYHDGKNICSEPHVICQNSYLYFQPITGSDSGSYTCTVQNPASTNTSRNSVQLNVIDLVSDVKITSNFTGLVWPGLDSVSLNCSARGTNVTYTWHLEAEPLPQDPRYHLSENNRVLTIHVTANDNGTFTCTASNEISNQTSNGIRFNLASNVSDVTLTSNTSGSYLWVGEDSVSLNCSADGSNVTFNWKLNGKPLTEDSHYHKSEVDSPRHSNLLISPVSKSDAGPFTCEASNLLNSKNSDTLNLSLAWNPENNITCSAEYDGQNIKLGCSWSGGQPKAIVSLIFNAKTENGTDSVTSPVVSIGDAQGKDLTCLGDQLGRTDKCTLPMVTPKAPGHDDKAITNANIGGTLKLTVSLEPGLPANFTWSHSPSSQSKTSIQIRESIVNSTDFSSSYVIQGVTEKDAGTYECIAKNVIGSTTFLFNVNVTEKAVPPADGLSGGAIAGIVIGVLAGVALIGIAVFFIVKKKKRSGDNKRISEPDDQLGATVTYATVQKKNGGVAETALTNNEQEDDVKYAELKFPNNNSPMATVPPPVETEYSTVKTSIKQ